MKTKLSVEKRAALEFFKVFSEEVILHLQSLGYHVQPHDSQEWAVSLSLVHSTSDGSVGFFFSPVLEEGTVVDVKYQIVREADLQTRRFRGDPAQDPESNARAFLSEIREQLTNQIPFGGPDETGVGRGLLTVSEAEADAAVREHLPGANPMP